VVDDFAGNSTYRGRIADEEKLAGGANLSHVTEFPERAGHAYTVSTH